MPSSAVPRLVAALLFLAAGLGIGCAPGAGPDGPAERPADAPAERATAAAPGGFGDTPAARAAEEFLAVVRAAEADAGRRFIRTRFAPEMRDALPPEEHLRQFGFLREDLEAGEIVDVRPRGAGKIDLTLESPGHRMRLRLEVEPEPPHRITRINGRAAGPALWAGSLEELDGELRRLAAADEFSGVVLVTRGRETLFHGAYGSADRSTGKAVETDTRFDIGSLTKLVTSAAVLRLAEEGRLGLDDPLGAHLDGFEPDVARVVTVRHLLRHTSGFGDYLTEPEFTADPGRFEAPADYLPLARARALAFEPGSRARYSNMGFVLLGAIVEVVTGRDYHDAIRALVFEPAGMESAGPRGGPDAARRYKWESGELVMVDSLYPEVNSPAGGGFAAVVDLDRFARALLEGRLLDESRTALLLNNFEPPPEGWTPPATIGFAGGASGLNAYLLMRRGTGEAGDLIDVIVVLANRDPPVAAAVAEEAEGVLLE